MTTLESLQAEIQMGAGMVELTSPREPETYMQFIHTRDAWKPAVHMDSASDLGRLSITQPEGKWTFHSSTQEK
ncbi:hypothetical protein [Nafulsella turpanensis]|uniref:hypothetical protein n=1 Tax=Nafulsella turpanensis TaxID=1265690 RepID=UPI000376495E|nr:hypothetical protein [Nafulsella turpanensis]